MGLSVTVIIVILFVQTKPTNIGTFIRMVPKVKTIFQK